MKTLLVCSERNLDKYVGQFFDGIVEVLHQPTTESIENDADQIKSQIEMLWNDDKSSANRGIDIYLDAASPYNAMLINYQITLEKSKGIVILLPHLENLQYNLEERLDKAKRIVEQEKRRV